MDLKKKKKSSILSLVIPGNVISLCCRKWYYSDYIKLMMEYRDDRENL